MLSNQILQSTVEALKAITRVDIAVTDVDGKAIASASLSEAGIEGLISSFAVSQADSQTAGGYQFFKIYDEQHLEYILVARGESDDVYMVGKLSAFQIQTLLVAYKEKFDRDNFMKNLLLDNLLLVDIYNRAKKLRIESAARRVVYLVEPRSGLEGEATEALRSFFAGKSKDFVTAVDEKSVIVVHELRPEEGYEEIRNTAETILGMFHAEAMIHVKIAYGNVVRDLKDVSRSYKEAKMALEVGKIFYADRDIAAYETLGIGRLIYQLPIPLCKMFISEIFTGLSPEDLDEEMLATIQKFFENNLNVSETSRQLYIHRNTLVYRLDKLERSTGLDLRVFDDAITFEIALMVVQYMNYMKQHEY